MKYINKYSDLKIFENKKIYSYSIDRYNDFFTIEYHYDDVVSLVKEDIISIIEILNKEYNTYISGDIEIYLFEDILTINNHFTKNYINIISSEFPTLLKSIKKHIDDVITYKDLSGDEYTFSKETIEDYVRYSKKYNI